MIEAQELTKHFGGTAAVDALSFRVEPGRVTGFLGPNGAGKTTTMRMILGLNHPTNGTVTVNGKSYRDYPSPLYEVGALLDATAVHGGRRAFHHLLWVAKTNGISRPRVDEVLGIVGLEGVAGQLVGTFSMGMRQRLGLAAALLGDPGVLILDEPANGLDAEGIRWLRDLLRGLAGQGRTVLVSSHLMSEMELTADHVLIIGKGRLVAAGRLASVLRQRSPAAALVRASRRRRLRAILKASGGDLTVEDHDRWLVRGLAAREIGELAAEHGIALHELTPWRSTLEEVYTQLVEDQIEHRAHQSMKR